MALPTLTHEGIKPYVTDEVHALLKRKFSQEEIPQLFSEAGVLRNVKECPVSICTKWHRDEANRIDGVFFRVIHERVLIAWIAPNVCRNEHNYIWIENGNTKLELKPVFGGVLHDFIKIALSGKKTKDPAPQFQPDQLDQPKAIAAFFDQDRDVLPDSIRTRIFPPPPQDPAPEQILTGPMWLAAC